MDEKDVEILSRDGWTVDCESPFELSREDGSFACGAAAEYVLSYVKDKFKAAQCSCGRGETMFPYDGCKQCIAEWQNERLKKEKPRRVCMECGKPATNTYGNLCDDHAHMIF